jgi:CheY-like chemotaxis protein
VVLRIRARAEAGAAGMQLCFEVSDTGLGIPQAQQDLVFAPFHQADAGAQRGGTGLGLAISSRQVELMGGQLQLQSTEGQGSRFSFRLHLAAGDRSSLPQDSGFGALVSLSEGQVLRVLVVDDIEANRDVLARMLSGLGAEVQQAEHGLQALQMLQESPARFDIVFLDIRMPVLDGIETLKRLRRELPQPQPVVVALTASALMHERQSYMREGFDDFIGKPFLFETVHQLLRQHLGPLFRPGATGADAAAASVEGHPQASPAGHHTAATQRLPGELLQLLQSAAETGWISELERGIEQLLQDCPAEQALGERLLDCLRQYDMARLQRELHALAASDELPA